MPCASWVVLVALVSHRRSAHPLSQCCPSSSARPSPTAGDNLQPCGGECVDTQNDVEHCGGCQPAAHVDATNSSQFYCSRGALIALAPIHSSSASTGHEILAIGFTTLLLGFVALGLGLHALRKEKVLRELQKIEVVERQKRAAIHAVHHHHTHTGQSTSGGSRSNGAYTGIGQTMPPPPPPSSAEPTTVAKEVRQPLRHQQDW